MRPNRLLINLLLTRPDFQIREIAELSESAPSTVGLYRKRLRELGGSAESWMALSDRDLLARLAHPPKSLKIPPDFGWNTRRWDDGYTLEELWEEYRSELGRRALSRAQFSKIMKRHAHTDQAIRVARFKNGGVTSEETWLQVSRERAIAKDMAMARRRRQRRKPRAAGVPEPAGGAVLSPRLWWMGRRRKRKAIALECGTMSGGNMSHE